MHRSYGPIGRLRALGRSETFECSHTRSTSSIGALSVPRKRVPAEKGPGILAVVQPREKYVDSLLAPLAQVQMLPEWSM